MKIVVVGKNSFIAGHVIAAVRSEGLAVTAISHDGVDEHVFAEAAWAINCARPPVPQAGADFDLKIATLAARAGAGFTMLSSRRVYPRNARWDAREDDAAAGDETPYGASKARGEAAVRGSGARHAIFRLSNVFGSEYGRASFMGRLLTNLKDRGEIRFDMSPATRRDFIPVETAAAVIARQLKQRTEGVFNLGGGPTACGDIADWVREGFGGGALIARDSAIRDEFFLNMDKTRAAFPAAAVTPAALRRRCMDLGEQLRRA